MDNSLHILCEAIKKISWQLKPQLNPTSFILMTGKSAQGKSAFLRQSQLEEYPLFGEDHAKLYYNQKGIILELGESWLNQTQTLLKNAIKQLNRCHKALRITGLILCIDVNELLNPDPEQMADNRKSHLQLLDRFGHGIGYKIDTAIIISKMDSLAGFCEFYQNEHAADLTKPLGFSIKKNPHQVKFTDVFNKQFYYLLDSLNQQVINKLHPARSSIKRTLIREFPLQLAGLRLPVQTLIQHLNDAQFSLHAIYLTSAEQGGTSIDRINKRIEHEYALSIRDTFPQAINYRSYFIEGAVTALQIHTTHTPQQDKSSHKLLIGAGVGVTAIALAFLGIHFLKTANLLDEASKELIAYETLSQQKGKNNVALFHLAKASDTIDKISSNSLSSPTIHQLKSRLHQNTEHELQEAFLPSLTQELELVINNPSETPVTRYKALKIYLMLGDVKHFASAPIELWFTSRWDKLDQPKSQKEYALLKQSLEKPLHNVTLKDQVVTDARNYLNALPTSYLYYSLAKESFPQDKQTLSIEGFNLASQQIPVYFTKGGFDTVLESLPAITKRIQDDNWVLARQDLTQLQEMLSQTYCYDYVTWWQTFLRKSQPDRYQDYQQGRQLTQKLRKTKAIYQLIGLVQAETKPDLSNNNSVFNQSVASQFTELNLMGKASTRELAQTLDELEEFITTLSVVNDKGRTAFSVTKGLFTQNNLSDPVSQLYSQAHHVPEPIGKWLKQIADDTWVLLINDSRQFINNQWQQTVYNDYKSTIAKRYPFTASQTAEINIDDFNHFFSPRGALNQFIETYLKPFINTSQAQWQPKAVNGFVLPITTEMMSELIRANVISTMFFPHHGEETRIEFSLQKINLDPVIANLTLMIGKTKLQDNQGSESYTKFSWPHDHAKLSLDSIDGKHYELAEQGVWALFKLLEKVNVLVDEKDSASLQILFEVNSNSGRYLLKSANQINPFTPGILNGFELDDKVV